MINTRELNSGNLVWLPGIKLIHVITTSDINQGLGADCEPIELTEDFLTKHTTAKRDKEKEGGERIVYDIKGIHISFLKGEWHLYIYLEEDDWYSFHWTQFKYVHELQNLYYWLSGKQELEIKL